MPTNNNLPVRQYVKQYSRILGTVFNATKAFSEAWAPIQMLNGIQENSKAFSVKTNSTPVVIGNYDKAATTQFGSGTGTGSRFGEMTEVIYADTDVPYAYELAIHEGLDRHTVNNDLNAAVADRLKLQSEAETRYMNTLNGKYMSETAGKTAALSDLTDATILALFNTLSTYFTDLEVAVPITAYVTSDIYNAIVDLTVNSRLKNSDVSITSNTISDFKGFTIKKEAAKYFDKNDTAQTKDVAYFCPAGVFIPFVGIQTARAIEAENFDGVKLQAAAKGGQYILDDNKTAVCKVTMSTAG